jgi:hypothetical protein
MAHTPSGAGGTGLYASAAVMPASAPYLMIPPNYHSSTTPVVDTINFDVGALSANNDQSFMVFY